MEVVAGVAGVAGVVGILSLIGDAIHGALMLKKFIHKIATTSRTLKDFTEAIDSLHTTLAAISDLLARAPEEWLVGPKAHNTNRLASLVEKCRADIDGWVKEMIVHHAKSSKALESFFRKLCVASKEGAYSEFHQKMARHLQGMQMSLMCLDGMIIPVMDMRKH